MKHGIVKIKKHAAWIKGATEETSKSYLENNNSEFTFHPQLYFIFLIDKIFLQRHPPPPPSHTQLDAKKCRSRDV